MTPKELAELEAHLTPAERDELHKLLALDMEEVRWRALPGPQTMAAISLADIVGFGGAAGGGKTDLIAGLTQTVHRRVLIARREKAQTEGIVQRLSEIRGGTDGLNSQKGIWQTERGIIELAGLDNPGDERRWQGRPHDLKAFDEVTEMREMQVRFVMGWNRTNDATLKPKVLMTFNPPTTVEGRWVLKFFGPWLDKSHQLYPTPPGQLRWCAMLPGEDGQSKDMWVDGSNQPLTGQPFVLVDGQVSYDFDPDSYHPEDIIQPKSRTFIPARLTDNPYYMATGYMSQLQALPEPLRSQMLYGSFTAGVEDDPWQVCPTAWVEAAQARWRERAPRGEMMSMGVDVARGGKDNTCTATRHDTGSHKYWFDKVKTTPGTQTPNGEKVAGLVIADWRDRAPIHLDVIGVGASPYDILNGAKLPVVGVNVSEKATATDRSGMLHFMNQRSQYWWQFRELLDPQYDSGIALPPDPELLAELCAPKWSVSGKVIKVQSREEIVEATGRSPDRATAVILASIDTPKLHELERPSLGREEVLNHDPYQGQHYTPQAYEHDPYR